MHGNVSCSADMAQTNHTIQFSYADNPAPCSASGNAAGTSNAYLTQITFPQTGSASHVYHFCYNYTLGDLTNSVGENGTGQTTTYKYNDPLDRLTETDFPDGGKTTITYGGETSVTTTQLITSSLSKTVTTNMDGMYHTIQTRLTSDPSGPDITDTTYDGLGRAWKVSNPHRSSSLSTDGITQTDVDGIGRTTSVTRQDNSVVHTIYGTQCLNSSSTFGTTVVDEAGNARQSCTDSLGRLLEVDEPSATQGGGTAGTGGVTINFNSSQESYGPFDPCTPHGQPSCPQTVYNNGTILISIGGCSASVGWGPAPPIGPYTTSTIASSLATAINNGSCPVTATAGGASVTITAKDVGTGTNYPFTVTNSYMTADCLGTTPCFSGPEFYATPTSGALSGGSGGVGSSSYVTLYNYDGLNNLTCVEQHGSATGQTGCSSPASSDPTSLWRIRRFSYDSLSRLLSAKNPESGTIAYAYDANGNVTSKSAPAPNQAQTSLATVTTTYQYDDLNRLLSKAYTDTVNSFITPKSLYAYDGQSLSGCPAQSAPGDTDSFPLGERTSMCDGSGGTAWIHDSMGRMLNVRRTIGNLTGKYDVDSYNLDGSVANLTALGYGLAYTYDGAGHPLTVKNSSDPFNYVTTAAYWPAGELSTASMGPAPITLNDSYQSRLQPALLSASTSAATIMSLCYDFHSGTAVNNPSCSIAANSTGDNGNVFQVINNRDGNRTQNFLYDGLNRITEAYTTGPNWGETFAIDAWSNLTSKGPVAGKTNSEGLTTSATWRNQLVGFGYDPAGNMTQNGSANYVYDDENRLIAAGGMSYIYDGDGQRVEKCTQGTSPGKCATSAIGTLYWTGVGGEVDAETDLSGNITANYIYFGGGRIAKRDPSKAVHFYYSDHLGSTSLITDANGTMSSHPQAESDYYPYGGEIVITADSTSNHYKYTGKERDSESGLDNFGARYDSSALGRFMTPDWAAKPITVPYASFGDPQTLNLYAYVENSPVNKADADGHTDPSQTKCEATDTSCKKKPRDAQKENDNEAQAEAQSEQQNTAQTQSHGNVDLTTIKYARNKDNNGVSIALGADVKNSTDKEFNWIQSITTNAPSTGHPANQPYLDTPPVGPKTIFYYHPGDMEAFAQAFNQTGHSYSAFFFDRPSKSLSDFPNLSTINFRADLSLVGINSKGSYHTLLRLTYGFTVDAKGVHPDPLRIVP